MGGSLDNPALRSAGRGRFDSARCRPPRPRSLVKLSIRSPRVSRRVTPRRTDPGVRSVPVSPEVAPGPCTAVRPDMVSPFPLSRRESSPMIRRIVVVAVVAAIPVPAGGASQERRSPTVKELVGNLATASSEEVARQSGDRAAAFLRQEHGPVPEEEIRSLANSLADLVLSLSLAWETELEEHILHDARATLWSSAVPPGAFMFGVGYATEENGFRGMVLPPFWWVAGHARRPSG